MKKNILFIVLILVVSTLLGVFIFKLSFRPYSLGLDISGGTLLIYQADLKGIKSADYNLAMTGLKDVIERRINYSGVKEPRIEINQAGNDWKLIVSLAGVKDIKEAIKMIGETPYLEFKGVRSEEETKTILDSKQTNIDPYFQSTSLTGKYLENASLAFDPNTNLPIVGIQFNEEGAKIFAELTKNNIGKPLAIYLDGTPISAPVVQEEITSGKAQISGNFTLGEAKQLVTRLNQGALPVPITLISQQTVGSILGEESLMKILKAGVIGLIAVILFMIIFYQFPGLIASLALIIYVIISLSIFKFIPITLTLAGITGFILSIGMTVDANILIFEYAKEEKRLGKTIGPALEEGSIKSWPAIRDSNISTIISAVILYYFTSSMIRGFALALAIGVGIGLLTSIFITKLFLKVIYLKR
ncbi:MAG: protein translocase subunit SecD [Candidatus Paceibacterota bacterium]|jgi:preprotein translocase subunit SecD